MKQNYSPSIIKIVIVSILLTFTGCARGSGDQSADVTASSKSMTKKQIYAQTEKIAGLYQDIYQKSKAQESLASVSTKQEIVSLLGDQGLSVVDEENQVDMQNPEAVKTFAQKAEEKKSGYVTVYLLQYDGGLIRLDLQTDDGAIQVKRTILNWKDGKPVASNYEKFKSHTWQYTQKGYLFLEQYHPDPYDGAPGQIAIRVEPLDQKLRDYNQKYVLPVTYDTCNLLSASWSSETLNQSAPDFYDLYEVTYRMIHQANVPYDVEYGGNQFEVPRADFESAIQTYLDVDAETIQKNTTYHADQSSYEYRPRGQYDSFLPYAAYPEVVAAQEQADGTVKLTIDGVWVRMNTDRVITSELTVKPEGEHWKYISNQVTYEEPEKIQNIYEPRLTKEAWTEYYQ